MALIAFDCDGPLAHFTRAFCAGLTRRGHKRHETEIKHWDLTKSISAEEAALSHEVISEPGFCADLEWVYGAKDLVRNLRSDGEDLIVVTSPYPSPTWIAERTHWLSELFPADDVMQVRSKRKQHIAADILVEDHPGILCAWLDANPKGFGILVNRPWNQPSALEFWPHTRMVRVATSADVYETIRSYLP